MTDQMRNPPSASSSTPSLSQAPAHPTLCSSGCGFWGNPRTENMCSLCYKQHLAKGGAPASSPSTSTSTSTTASTTASTTPSVESDTAADAAAAGSAASPIDNVPADDGVAPSSSSSVDTVADIPPETVSASATTSTLPAVPSPSPSTTTTDLPIVSQLSDAGSDPALMPLSSSSSSTSSSTELASAATSPSLSDSATTSTASDATATDATATTTASSDNKKRKNRCTFCQKKVGLTFFACRCDESAMFCVAHRYPHAHQCTHDHRNDQQSKLLKSNPIVKNAQFEKM